MQAGVKSDQRSRNIANTFADIIREERESSDKFDKNIRIIVRRSLEIQSIGITGDELSEENLDAFIRRCAHLIEFCMLAFIVSLTLNIFKLRWYNVVIYTLFIALLGGVIDEFSRQFIQGRHGAIDDAVLDFLGGILGCIILYLIKLSTYSIKRVVKFIKFKLDTYRK
jgi:VanZ family protein